MADQGRGIRRRIVPALIGAAAVVGLSAFVIWQIAGFVSSPRPSTSRSTLPAQPPAVPTVYYPPSQPITEAKAHPGSDAFIRTIGAAKAVRAGFGYREDDRSPTGIHIFTVPPEQKKVKMRFDVDDPDSEDMIEYPIPDEVLTLKGSFNDRIVILDPAARKLYELFALRKEGNGWKTCSGLCFDLTSSKPREAGKKGGCSSGLPILPGLVRVDEVKAGRIEHAMLFTVNKTQKGWIAPACAFASKDSNEKLPPMGLRLRLKKDFNTSQLTKNAQVIAEALKTYGMLLADNGLDMELWGEASEWWKEEDMDSLRRIKAADFEAIDTGPIANR